MPLNDRTADAERAGDRRALDALARDIARPPAEWMLAACREALGLPHATPQECGLGLSLSPPYDIRRLGGRLHYRRTVFLNDLDIAIYEGFACEVGGAMAKARQGHLYAVMHYPIEKDQ